MASSIPVAVIEEVENLTGLKIRSFSPASGGCINHGGKLVTADAIYFLKWNDREKFPGMFEAEAKGLRLLKNTGALEIPQVALAGESGSFQFLLMEYISEADRSATYWEEFGSGLAKLHLTRSKQFGLDHDNYVGSLPQVNIQSASWIEFFIEQRLRVQLRKAVDSGKLEKIFISRFEKLFRRLPFILCEEAPSLLHGDLWSGNIITTSIGQPCLIDPAVYFGHREVDLAMTQLFGGFDPSFLGSYNNVYPLQSDYEERLELYNLYPLLVHVNLFGGGYSQQVSGVLKKLI